MKIISIDVNGLTDVLEKLYGLERNEAKKALKAAVNDTAKQARKLLAKNANAIYARKSKKDFDKSMTIKKGVVSKPTATITSKGPISEPLNYSASPTTLAQQQHRKLAAKVKVLSRSPKKALEFNGNKAFLAKFEWNPLTGKMNRTPHFSIVAATGKKKPDKPILHTFYSPAVPIALGSDRNMRIAEPMIRQKLAENLNKHIEEVLSKK